MAAVLALSGCSEYGYFSLPAGVGLARLIALLAGLVVAVPALLGLLALIVVWRAGSRSTAWFVVGVVALSLVVLVGVATVVNDLFLSTE